MSVDILARALASQALAATGTPPNLSNSVATWNAAGTVFTGFKLNVTDTASDPNSLLMDLQRNGTSYFKVDRTASATVAGAMNIASNCNVTGNFVLGTNASTIYLGAANDLILARDAANTLAQRNGTSAQAFNLYNTYTDASNYERGVFGFVANALNIGTQNAGTGVARVTRIISGMGNPVQMSPAGTDFWQFSSGGYLFPNADNATDIGLVGNSPRYIRAATSLITNGATVTVNTPTLNLAQTWNNVATVFKGIFLNVTDAASDPNSLLMDLQVGGASQFSVRKNGTLTAPYVQATNYVLSGGQYYARSNTAIIYMGTADDVVLARDAANTLAQRNGTAGQTFNIYNTYTDASNYERGIASWTGNTFVVGSQSAGTGVARNIAIDSPSQILFRLGGGNQLALASQLFYPIADNNIDLGSATNGFRYIRAATQFQAIPTWNNAATTFPAPIFANVTDTASAAASLLMDLQVGGASQFKVSKAGSVSLATQNFSALYPYDANTTALRGNGGWGLNCGQGFVRMGPAALQWGVDFNNSDVILTRDAANTLAQKNGTAAQTFRVYNTFTDASNYERGVFGFNGGALIIGAEVAGTGAYKNVAFQASSSLYFRSGSAVTDRWIIDGNGHLNGATDNTYDLGLVGASPRYIRAATQFQAIPTWNNAATTFPAPIFANVTDTASAATSLLMDLQKGGVSQFKVDKLGNATMTGSLLLGNNNNLYFGGGVTTLNMGTTTTLNWNNDVNLVRDAANTLALRNGTNGQRFNIYQTYTDVSNYSQGYFSASYSLFQIGTANAGTGTGMSLQLNSATSVIYCNGLFVPVADGGTDLGGGVNRWGNFYLGKNYIHNPTWNSAATTFTAMQLNVTDTASNPGSLLMDLQVGGVSKFSVRKDGLLTLVNTGATNNALMRLTSQGYLGTDTSQIYLFSTGTGSSYVSFGPTGTVQVANSGSLSWGSSGSATGTQDLILARDAANTLAQRNGTAAQTFNLYNTFTDVSNLERGFIRYSANALTIGHEALGTGSAARSVNFVTNGATYLALNSTLAVWNINSGGHIVNNADNSYDIGTGTANPRYIRASSAIQTKALTVATLPAAATALAGARSFVTDSSVVAAGNFGAIVAGAGANATPVYSDGTNWRIG